MNSFRRFTRSAFARTISHKIIPVTMGAAMFGMGCMGKYFHEPILAFQNKTVS